MQFNVNGMDNFNFYRHFIDERTGRDWFYASFILDYCELLLYKRILFEKYMKILHAFEIDCSAIWREMYCNFTPIQCIQYSPVFTLAVIYHYIRFDSIILKTIKKFLRKHQQDTIIEGINSN